MAGSLIEREMRNAVIDKIRQFRPNSRIVHELNTNGMGSPRADLAAIGVDEILMFEIKSSKDVLKRLEKQWTAFQRCSHRAFIVMDKKFFTVKEFADSRKPSFETPDEVKQLNNCYFDNIWIYPEVKATDYLFNYSWQVQKDWGRTRFNTPDTRAMLNLLWREELLTICRNLQLTYSSKDNMVALIERMILGLTGRQIVEGVCAALRGRKFSEADEEIINANQNLAIAV